MNERLDLLAIKRKAEAAGATDVVERPLTPREITFTVRYTDPETGLLLETSVVSRIMTATERATAARMVAQMVGGSGWESVPILHRGRFHALSVCCCQLRDAPDWLMKWLSEDNVLLDALYTECEKHEIFFFRGGYQESEGDQGTKGLAIVSPLTSGDPKLQK